MYTAAYPAGLINNGQKKGNYAMDEYTYAIGCWEYILNRTIVIVPREAKECRISTKLCAAIIHRDIHPHLEEAITESVIGINLTDEPDTLLIHIPIATAMGIIDTENPAILTKLPEFKCSPRAIKKRYFNTPEYRMHLRVLHATKAVDFNLPRKINSSDIIGVKKDIAHWFITHGYRNSYGAPPVEAYLGMFDAAKLHQESPKRKRCRGKKACTRAAPHAREAGKCFSKFLHAFKITAFNVTAAKPIYNFTTAEIMQRLGLVLVAFAEGHIYKPRWNLVVKYANKIIELCEADDQLPSAYLKVRHFTSFGELENIRIRSYAQFYNSILRHENNDLHGTTTL